jgi:hypothetical protein
MDTDAPPTRKFASVPRDPFWLTSQYSTHELAGQHVRINWLRGGTVVSWGVYRMEAGAYGHSKHIQSIHAVPLEGAGCGAAAFDFDQTDAILLHRTNECPKAYSFAANLDYDREREQNPDLERLVHERRLRKMKDVEGADRWESSIGPVLSTADVPEEPCSLSEDLGGEHVRRD